MMSNGNVLPFDEHFQQHFVNHLLRDSSFLERVAADISPELFSSEYGQRVARLTLDFFAENSAAPSTLVFRVLDKLLERQLMSPEVHKNLCVYIDGLFALDLQNRSFLLREFDNFIRHQQFKRQIIPITEHVKRGDFDAAETLMKEIFTTKSRRELDLGREITSDPSNRIIRRQQSDKRRLWTLIPELDRCTPGLVAGEFAVLQSQRSSAGKSAGLVFLTRSYVFQAAKVLIYSLEMSEEDYEDRIDMCVAGLVDKNLLERHKIQECLRRMFRRGGGIWVKQFPGSLTSVEDLREHKQMLESVHGFHADAVMLDYADELGPSRQSVAENGFERGKENYSLLRGWAVQDELVIWTGMQSNRSALEATVADQEHSGESIAKAWIADLIISINRTPEEEKAGLTRLWKVKDRRGQARLSFTIRSDFSRMQFWKRDM